MEPAFWHARWQASEIGFHQDEINPYLQAHWPALHSAPNGCVLVPLCGKSHDLLWLAGQGQRVLGVEISPIAVAAFFEENELAFTATADLRFVQRQAAEISVLEGDFFELTPADVEGVTCVYDRAAMIALPPALRSRYAEHLMSLLAPGVSLLLITLDYPPEQTEGPPFAVSEREVRSVYAAGFHVETLAVHDILADQPRFQARGLTRLQEQVFHLRRR